MKKYIIAAVIAIVSGCSDRIERTLDFSGTLVPARISSLLEISVDLDDYTPVSLEWAGAEWDGIGFMTYDIAFDRIGGDFSRPVAVFHAPGIEDSSMELSKDEMKSVFSAASVTSKDREVSVQWIVRTAAGTQKLSSAPAVIHMAMTPDPDAFVAGNPVYIAGEGALESGMSMTYIPSIDYDFKAAHYNDNSSLKNFNYEIFTELGAGKPYYFWSGTTTGDKDWIFAVNPEKPQGYSTVTRSILKDADMTASVSSSGVYRIRMNTSSGEIYIKKVNSVSLRYWNGSVHDNTMQYKGNGVWSIDLNVPAGSFGYKFLFMGLDSDQPTGAEYPSQAYSSDREDRYWRIVTVIGGAATAANPRAAGTWAFPADAMGRTSTYTVYMNDTYGAYTHYIE
ncbi:MAG: hypothetical protein NC115_03860 [Bacteroidales bacterium]|nr:hypothetical protein [Bacteroidales bacterium]